MEEQKVVERPLMSEEEFSDYMKNNTAGTSKAGIFHLATFEAVGKFKSVRRAIRRGLVSPEGVIYPKRPFSNSKCTRNSITYKRKKVYEELKTRKLA